MIHARIAIALLATTALPALAVDAEKTAPGMQFSTTAALDLASAYVFRGMTVNRNPVLQPTLKLQTGGLTVGAWGNKALDAEEEEVEEEVDAFASFDIPLEALTLSLGYTEYIYPDSDFDNDQEIMAKITLPILLNPFLAVYHGVGGGIWGSNYYELGLRHEVFAQNAMTGALAGTMAYLDRETGEDGISHLTLSAAGSYKIITASLNYVVETDDDVNDLNGQDQFFVTTGASYTF